MYLIQFRQPPDSQSRARLLAAGVDLLHYVPDDAFVARCRSVSLQQLRAFSFVEWIGDYRPEHKIHAALLTKANAQLAAQTIGITVLLVPRASSSDLNTTRTRFAQIEQESTLRSGTVIRGKVSPAQLDFLARSDAVIWIESAPAIRLYDEVASKIVAGNGGPRTLLSQSLGYDGRGVKVGVADTGLNNGGAATMHPDLFGRTPVFMYYGQLTDAADEHSHGTHVTGIIAGNGATGETDANGALYGLGVAPGASIVVQRIFDAAGNFVAPPSNERLTRDATRAGAVIGSNSWGDDTQGRYDVNAMEFDELVRDADALMLGDQQYVLEFSAGNAGPAGQTIGSPAVAKNVIATGASENDRTDMLIYADGPDVMADFSSRGPCEDGRIKPDVVAPGTWVSSLQSASATDQYAWAPIDSYYQYQGGTSQSGPHASGAAAVFVQYYRATHTNATPSPALVKAALINSTTDLLQEDPTPNNNEGWGRIDLPLLLQSPLSFDFTDQSVLLTNGAVFEHRIVVANSTQPLKVTMAYTDPPGFPGTLPALVNDLDLEVVGPDGALYRGNQFDLGESIPNPPASDNINNIEGVFLSAPLPGEYIVRVRARQVVQDARVDTPEIDQDFALVISAVILPPGVGAIFLDRGAYTAPSQIKLTLIDSTLAGKPNATVRITSTTETNGETVLLTPSTSSGGFTGSIATATGPAMPDGRLEIANNDTIQVIYFDAALGSNRIATARADLVPPVLTNLKITNAFGRVVISWSSDEPSTSIVRFGTNPAPASLNLAATNRALVTDHSIALSGLAPGRTYYCYVVSADEAGNATTNNNGGALFSFIVAAVSPILLVDEYQDSFFGTPPLSGYTNALNQVGINYDVWDVGRLGSPALANLQPYRAVIWRVPELIGTWSAAERTSISNYLHSGGGLLVASMQVLSRLDEAGATPFGHTVLQTQSYIADTGAVEVVGEPYDPIGRGLDLAMNYSVYGLVPGDITEAITPEQTATGIFVNEVGLTVGLRWPAIGQKAPGRLVFLSFPLDAVPMGNGVNDRVNLLRNILSFLAPGASGTATISLDSSAYTLPSVVTVQVGDVHRAGQMIVAATASSATQPGGLPINLVATADPAVFTGSFNLVSGTNPPSAGKLLATNGDTVTVKYYDSLNSRFVTASATVDTTPPQISNVAADPDYLQAVISWDTSEFADALVQFGQSSLLNRTAYDPTPGTNHAVTITGLSPNRTYYFRVVSRDLAGNAATADNNGKLYTVHTLLPLLVPWSDDMEHGATNWSTVTSDGSQSAWTLGVPNNGQVTNAHSLTHAWGSNLSGKPIDFVECFLISPALYLTNGNRATLTFWQAYDFTDLTGYDIQYGEVDIVTNSTGSAIPIATFGDMTAGWEPAQVDLSPYLGDIVYLIWHYILFSTATAPRPGWVIDDVSVAVSTVQPGTIQISNNLFQATWVLSGAMYLQGKGIGTILTNAPAGQYILEFADVPYYLTPPAQTSTLVAGGTISFQGTYTFPDVNHNGMSDLWEMAYFGTVSTNRTTSTDTDGDGMTDYAEFIAGTDPTNALSNLRAAVQPVGSAVYRLQWTSVPGRGYRVLGSTNGVVWTPLTDWSRATGPMSFYTLPARGPTTPYLYRIQVRQ